VKLEFEKYPGAYAEIDFEVPAVVVIDPGHGGTENATSSSWNNATSPSGVLEKTMTLDYGLALRDALRAKAKQDKLNIQKASAEGCRAIESTGLPNQFRKYCY
jgi:hypothetical protein